MDFHIKYITPDIKLSTYDDKLFKTETVFEYHMLVWFISGETKIIQADRSYTFQAGDIFLIPRNHLATIINYPKDGLPHKAVVMHLTTERLKKFYSNIDTEPKNLRKKTGIHIFNNHPLLESCMASLIPYFDMKEPFPEHIASLKIMEAISIIREIDKNTDAVLADFEEPGKIDLISFMEKNYMFNMPLERFGYLTGRSLSTFNRDFRKAFQRTPQRWLTKKRLELAYYQLTEKNKKPTDVFMEVGFEDLSHFSYAFKKQYGYAPSGVR
ncbi:helix-turn-helix domain-containing protein [Chryseobacterium populi]|uniref:DNA-binding domain-containing protein, AraC-type n=1 Tax=Chryseobacterium populi TaxID=1144316 RepID=J2JYM7_9FLAO|nr:AraC family transcriptional regulator [Chryseobacterium populi]EJL72980.1 DNA-binding domain-containing protein, AraC-type [Chryseobacterium populi]